MRTYFVVVEFKEAEGRPNDEIVAVLEYSLPSHNFVTFRTVAGFLATYNLDSIRCFNMEPEEEADASTD